MARLIGVLLLVAIFAVLALAILVALVVAYNYIFQLEGPVGSWVADRWRDRRDARRPTAPPVPRPNDGRDRDGTWMCLWHVGPLGPPVAPLLPLLAFDEGSTRPRLLPFPGDGDESDDIAIHYADFIAFHTKDTWKRSQERELDGVLTITGSRLVVRGVGPTPPADMEAGQYWANRSAPVGHVPYAFIDSMELRSIEKVGSPVLTVSTLQRRGDVVWRGHLSVGFGDWDQADRAVRLLADRFLRFWTDGGTATMEENVALLVGKDEDQMVHALAALEPIARGDATLRDRIKLNVGVTVSDYWPKSDA